MNLDLLREVYDRFHPPLERPRVSYSVVGSGTASYVYRVTAFNETGETDGEEIVVVNAPSSLNYVQYITLSWSKVDRAKGYRIYGRSSDVFGLLREVGSDVLSYTDYGVDVPDISKVPPQQNQTGRIDWDKVVFLPGRPLQSAELNEIQSILDYKLSKTGKALLGDGDIVSGCQIIVDKVRARATITDGQIVIGGQVRDVRGGTISIYTDGVCYVGVKVNEIWKDEVDDPVLRDPAQGYPGYQTAGAIRKIYQYEWKCVRDEKEVDVVVWKLVDGNVFLARRAGEYTPIERMIATRVDDLQGETLVKGLDVRILPSEKRRDEIQIEIDEGVAYVGGARLEIPAPRKLVEKIAIEYDTAVEDTSDRTGYLYSVDLTPVKSVDSVTIRVKVTETRVVPSTQDVCGWYFDDIGVSIDSILGVWTNSTKTTAYTFSNTDPGCAGRTTDVVLSGSGFALNPAKFTPGNSYYIEYLKFYTAVKGKRVKAYQEDSFVYSTATATYTLSKKDIISSRRTRVVVEDANGVVYREGVDYSVDTGRTDTSIGDASITWISGGNHPADGVEFKVKYYYWEHAVEGDYVSVDSYLDDTDPYGDFTYEDVDNPDVIDFRANGVKPASEKPSILVQYKYFLHQYAWLVLDREGNFSLLKGQASRDPVIPFVPQGVLPRALVYMPAFSQRVLLQASREYEVKKTRDINLLERRVENVEYNLGLTELEVELLKKETIQPKKGLLTDAFVDESVMDTNTATCSIEVATGSLLLPRDYRVLAGSVGSVSGLVRKGRAYLLPYNHETLAEQLIWTRDILPINPFEVYVPPILVQLFPNVDYWVERVEEVQVITEVQNVRAGSISGQSLQDIVNQVRRLWGRDPTLVNYSESSWVRWGWLHVTGTGVARVVDSYTRYEGTRLVRVEVIPYLRQRIVYIKAEGFLPFQDNIYAEFDGVRVGLSPVSQGELDSVGVGWTAVGSIGTVSGTMKAGGEGAIVGKFTIPRGCLAGRKTVKVGVVGDGDVVGYAYYYGMGRREVYARIYRNVVTNIDIPFSISRSEYVDPVAQSFRVEDPEGVFLTRIKVWFAKVPATGEGGVWCVVRRLGDEGYPAGDPIAGKYLSKSQIMSMMGITGPTQTCYPLREDNAVVFEFDEPVYLAPGWYAFALLNTAPGYFVWTARVGGTIDGKVGDTSFRKGERLTSQTHEGVVFVSANAVTYDTMQDYDLVFRVERASFTRSEGSMEVGFPVGTGFSEFVYATNVFVPQPAKCETEYWDGNTWNAFNPWEDAEHSEMLPYLNIGRKMDSGSFKVRYRVFGTEKVSPVIWGNVMNLYAYWYATSGEYRTKEVNLGTQTFSTIKVWIDQQLNGGSVQYQVSFDGGSTWHNLPQVTSRALAFGFEEVELGGSVESITGQARAVASRFIVRIRLGNSGAEWTSPRLRRLRVIIY